MNSQEDHSQIGQQNVMPIVSENTRRYVNFYDIQKYQSLAAQTNNQNHACSPIYINWNRQKPHQIQNHYINRISAIQFLIQHQLNQCCLNFKLFLKLGFHKYNFIEISKIRKMSVNNSIMFDQQGLRYRIQHLVSTYKVQVSITKDRINKVWKQIELPVKSYQTQLINSLTIRQKLNGDIMLTFNQYEFMLNLKTDRNLGQFLSIRTDTNIRILQFQQTQQFLNEDNGGCSKNKCLIF